MKALVPAQRAAIVAIVVSTAVILIYAVLQGDPVRELQHVLGAAFWDHRSSQRLPGIISWAAKINLIALIILIFYPAIRRTIRWIKSGSA